MLKSYELLKIIQFLEEHGIKNYSINEDGIVDVDGDVDLSDKNLTSIPVQFGRVSGWFDCSHNQLTSLKGAPREVEGWFYCRINKKNFTKQDVRAVSEVWEYIYC